jgi:hypothetical protein
MTDAEVRDLVSRVFREGFEDLGFQGATVRSEQDFDGTSVLRVRARFGNADVSSDRLTEALHRIRSELLNKGEERFVFLSIDSSENEMIEEDVD